MKLVREENEYYLFNDGKPFATTEEGLAKHYGKRLSVENCNDLFGIVNIEKLVEEEYLKFDQETRIVHRRQLQESLVNMFNKAIELNKDKLFTVEDMQLFAGFAIGYTQNGIQKDTEKY